MARTGREVCIKTGTVTYCKASPITDCSCECDDKFEDPFYLEPEPTIDNPGELIRQMNHVLGVWEKSQRSTGDLQKLDILWKISQLLMLKRVDGSQPLVITVF